MGDASISSTRDAYEGAEAPWNNTKVGSYSYDGFHASASGHVLRFGERDRQDDGAQGCIAGRHRFGIRMIQYFINRGGKGLSATRRGGLEKAKRILQRRAARQKAVAKKR